MSVTRIFELYDPKKHSVRARSVDQKINDQYIDNAILMQLGLRVGDKITVTYSKTEVADGKN